MVAHDLMHLGARWSSKKYKGMHLPKVRGRCGYSTLKSAARNNTDRKRPVSQENSVASRDDGFERTTWSDTMHLPTHELMHLKL